MKNFNVNYMQENGTAKKTMTRKEYDEQLALRFAAAEEKRHEEASARAKAEYAAKSDEEKQKTMNEFADIENKPITKQIAEGYAKHEDITFFAVASTGLNTEDKSRAVKREDGKLERVIIPKDEPTLFKAETYTYSEAKGAYTLSDSISIFIEASDTVVQRAIKTAQDGGYDVFANADFVLEDYLAGNDVLPKDEAKAQIANYLNKQSGMVVCYGAFHENILKGNAFPTAEGSLDLNRAMVEQAKFGNASLGSCLNQILKKEKDDKLALASTTEKLIADVVCLNALMSDFGKTVPFLANEESLSKFSDKDRQALGDADESVRVVAEERRRARSRAEMAEARRRLRDRERDVSQSKETLVSQETLVSPNAPLSRREGIMNRHRGIAEQASSEALSEQMAAEQNEPKQSVAKQPVVQTLTGISVAAQFMDFAKEKAPYSVEQFIQGVSLKSGLNVKCTVPGKEEIHPDERTVIISSAPVPKEHSENLVYLTVTDAMPFDRMFMTARRMQPTNIIVVDDGFEPFLEKLTKETEVTAPAQVQGTVPEQVTDKVPDSEAPVREVQPTSEKTAQETKAPVASSNFDDLVKAITVQNELLAKQNEISAKQAEIEADKIAEMQKQTILMERQAETMERLTILMDNLTKVYSEKDVQNLRIEAESEKEELLRDFGKAAEGIRSPKAEELDVEPEFRDPFMEDTGKPLEKRFEDAEGRP